MGDRKNLKIDESVFNRLANSKPENSTWSGFLGHLLRAYHDPRPRIPNTISNDATGQERWQEVADLDKQELAEDAKELMEEVDFKQLLQSTDNSTEAAAELIAERTADRVIEKLKEEET
jgi:hypothetical protein